MSHLLEAQEQCIPTKRKLCVNTVRPVSMNKELLNKTKYKKKAYREWKQGQVAWEEYRDIVWAACDQVRKAKALIDRIKSGQRHQGQQKQASVSTSMIEEKRGTSPWDLVSWDMKKAEILKDFFLSSPLSVLATPPKLQMSKAGTGTVKNCPLQKIRFKTTYGPWRCICTWDLMKWIHGS